MLKEKLIILYSTRWKIPEPQYSYVQYTNIRLFAIYCHLPYNLILYTRLGEIQDKQTRKFIFFMLASPHQKCSKTNQKYAFHAKGKHSTKAHIFLRQQRWYIGLLLTHNIFVLFL